MGSWATSRATQAVVAGVDLHLDPSGGGVRAGLIGALREAVRSGRLGPGTRLPSSRGLAGDLGIARNTVADAYAELVAEGWLTARQGSGTRVADRAVAAPAPRPPRRPATPVPPTHDLRSGLPDVSAFPRAEWSRAFRRALARAPADAFTYGSPFGRIELRTALAGYLARTRGVQTEPERIVVCSGATHGLLLLAAVLRRRRVRAMALEAYGLDVHHRVLAAAGVATRPLPLDENGARVDRLADLPDAAAALLTPAHQFPTGVALHPDRRSAVIDWARATGGLVIDDDYDGEFRYDRQPVGALQGLDPDRVVHLGTASKALAPALRLGWMAVPAGLLLDLEQVVTGLGPTTTGVLDQLALAQMLESAAYDRHVRAMRLYYRRRRDELVAALAAHAPSSRVSGIAAGLHAVVELPGGEDAALRAAGRRGVAVHGLSRFRHPSAPADRDALVVGYGTPSASAWSGALEALCRAVHDAR